MDKYEELHEYLKRRFPKARFVISCFKKIKEVETKKLTKKDVIIYADEYYIGDKDYNDFFVIHKKPGKKYITYADVIDHLIEKRFIRDDCDHKFLENIREAYEQRNNNSIPVYASFWGS